MDRAIPGDARARMARCVPPYRPWRDEGAGDDVARKSSRACRTLAAMARLCRDAFVAFAARSTYRCARTGPQPKGKGNAMNPNDAANVSFTKLDSPLGPMIATAESGVLTGLYFTGQRWF